MIFCIGLTAAGVGNGAAQELDFTLNVSAQDLLIECEKGEIDLASLTDDQRLRLAACLTTSLATGGDGGSKGDLVLNGSDIEDEDGSQAWVPNASTSDDENIGSTWSFGFHGSDFEDEDGFQPWVPNASTSDNEDIELEWDFGFNGFDFEDEDGSHAWVPNASTSDDEECAGNEEIPTHPSPPGATFSQGDVIAAMSDLSNKQIFEEIDSYSGSSIRGQQFIFIQGRMPGQEASQVFMMDMTGSDDPCSGGGIPVGGPVPGTDWMLVEGPYGAALSEKLNWGSIVSWPSKEPVGNSGSQVLEGFDQLIDQDFDWGSMISDKNVYSR